MAISWFDEFESYLSGYDATFSKYFDPRFQRWSGFMKFKTTTSANSFLSKGNMSYKGYTVNISAADDWYQPGWLDTLSSPFPFGQSIAAKIPDHCLFEMFVHLNILDLITVASICSRFQSAAKQAFKQKFSQINIDELISQVMEATKVIEMLQHFGSCIKELEVSGLEISDSYIITNDFMRSIAIRCCSPSLEVLRIKRTEMDNRVLTEDIDTCMKALRDCKKLKHLEIDGVKYWSIPSEANAFNFTLPELKSISFKTVSDLNTLHLTKILSSHSKLEKISISGCRVEPNILSDIAKYVPRIKELMYTDPDIFSDCSRAQLMSIVKLKSLTRLSIDMVATARTNCILIEKMVAANVSLEYLNLRKRSVNRKLVEAIGRMKSINSLRFTNMTRSPSEMNFGQLVKSLPKLTKIELETSKGIKAIDLAKFTRQ